MPEECLYNGIFIEGALAVFSALILGFYLGVVVHAKVRGRERES